MPSTVDACDGFRTLAGQLLLRSRIIVAAGGNRFSEQFTRGNSNALETENRYATGISRIKEPGQR